ncbi:MAG: divalent metal cation transporter [Chloroflexi bacterium]|nr:divalent metal cation transporter [Chloroflexota bacterium]
MRPRWRARRRRRKRAEAGAMAFVRASLPALITGGAGDDPAGILTYTVVGATTGFSQLWLILLSTPMLAAANSMAARVALAAKDGLAAVIRKRYGRTASMVIVLALAAANIATISADAAGVAAALEMVTGIRWEWLLPLILAVLLLVLQEGYTRVKRVLVSLSAVLLAYVFAALLAHPEWPAVFKATFLPHVSTQRAWLVASLGILGTTVSPYLLFWQAGEEIEELQEGIIIQANTSDAGVWLGMLFSNLIAFFIVVAAAATIHSQGGQIQTVADAAQALAPLGRVGQALFITGFLAAGLLALPVLAGSTAYAVAEAFGWPEGLGAAKAHARGFYAVLVGSLLVGMGLALWPHFRPTEALFYSQVLDGALLPVLMLMLLVLSNDRRIVGEATNPRWINLTAVMTIGLALLANALALFG